MGVMSLLGGSLQARGGSMGNDVTSSCRDITAPNLYGEKKKIFFVVNSFFLGFGFFPS